MTLPYEQVNAQDRACKFLAKLMDAGESKRVPAWVREEARKIMRHLIAAKELEWLQETQRKDRRIR